MLARRELVLGLGFAPLAASPRAALAQSAVPAGKLIAHRGFGTLGAPRALGPENTMAAFRQAAAAGARYMETDAQVTADGEVVLMHDRTVDRTTSGSGEVARLSFAEIRALDAGSRFAERFRGEKVPTLAEYFAFCKQRGLFATPEIKEYRSRDDIALMLDAMRRHGDPARTIWCSFRLEDLILLRGALGERDCGVGLVGSNPKNLAAFAALGGRRAMLMNHRPLLKNLDWISDCHGAGVEIWPWTVGSTEIARALLEKGCDLIISDGLL
jgi:glycerophosphoryl diester phosphodiesterase